MSLATLAPKLQQLPDIEYPAAALGTWGWAPWTLDPEGRKRRYIRLQAYSQNEQDVCAPHPTRRCAAWYFSCHHRIVMAELRSALGLRPDWNHVCNVSFHQK